MVRRRAALGGTPARETALACVEAGIEAAHPDRVVRERVSLEGDVLAVAGATYDLGAYDEVVVLGGGKAAGGVAAALEDLLSDRLAGGAVVTDDPVATDRVDVLAGDHPVPSERGVEAAEAVLERARAAGERTLVLAVVTGGGSALLPAPVEGVSLADLRAVTEDLLAAGVAIEEVNAVRKHLSRSKGGRLARRAAPATVVGLLFSDVVGDDPATIGSGPTAPDPTTPAEALSVLERAGVDVPTGVRTRLERARDEGADTPTPDDPCFDRVDNHVLAGADTALAAAEEVAADRGYEPLVLSSRIRGEAREAGLFHVAVAEECLASGRPVSPPAVLLSGGETTVTVRGEGVGGPNLEFALRAALDLPAGTALAAVDTDGRDGSSDAAGALVDADTVTDSDAARRALADNDALTYLEECGGTIETGPTGTNLNDLRALVVEADESA